MATIIIITPPPTPQQGADEAHQVHFIGPKPDDLTSFADAVLKAGEEK